MPASLGAAHIPDEVSMSQTEARSFDGPPTGPAVGGAGRPTRPTGDASASLIRTLTVTIFLQWLGATAIVPMLPIYIRHLGGSDALAGMVMAAFFAAGVVSQYPVGRLADRIGRRPVLVGGLVTYGAASLSFLAPVGPEPPSGCAPCRASAPARRPWPRWP